MPRSSGQKARPRRAIAFEGLPISSCVPNVTDPCRLVTMPMMDFSVVVLPAPLRPSSVTTSPVRTSKSTPCSTWHSPYQALSPLTARSDSGMRLAQISLDHQRVGGHRPVIALGQDLAPLQHRDGVREVGHHREVVLDHEDGAP